MDSSIIRLLKIVDLNISNSQKASQEESAASAPSVITKFDYVQIDNKVISVVILEEEKNLRSTTEDTARQTPLQSDQTQGQRRRSSSSSEDDEE